MLKNVGSLDRILRIAVGVALIAYALGFFGPGAYTWLGWIGVVPILTSFMGTCPAYSIFGLSTRGKKSD